MKSIGMYRGFVRLFESKMDRSLLAAFGALGIFITACFTLGGAVRLGPATAQTLTISDRVERYLVHISTDKPIYHPGEKLYVRGVFLSASGHAPGAAGPATYEIKGSKGETIASGAANIVDSVAGLSWNIPSDQAGGQYTIRILQPFSGDAPAERKFDIRTYRTPRLNSQIVFVRDGYGPGDTVNASLHVDRAEGGKPAGARVLASARVDAEEVWKGETVIDSSGNASAAFKLPASMSRGDGTLALTILDGSTVETATKTIPILLQTLDVAIYPEGGDLVAGLPNRIYFEGRSPNQKPADMAGVVVTASGKEVTPFRTEHSGRGRFAFTPVRGESYSLRITEPAGIKASFPLPAVKDSGVVLTSTDDITRRSRDVVVRVAASAAGEYGIELSQKGRELAFKSLHLHANQPTEVALTVPRALDGVIVATVYDDRKTPIAERLLFRQPEHSLKVTVTADQDNYVPGDNVTIQVSTTDDAGRPAAAVVGLTVTDSTVLEMIDRREQAPQLPVMVLLENDVRNLSDAHVYLDESNPIAPLATDLLLGTQGWRRFAMMDLEKFVVDNGDAARRAMAIRAITNTPAGFAGMASSIMGTVMDPTAALIPGVTLQARSVSTGVVTTVVTNDSGSYAFPPLPPGTYQVTAALQGFQTVVATVVNPGSSQSQHLNFTLSLGAFGNSVSVSVDASVLKESSASIGEVLSAERVRNLPMVGNNVLDLLAVLPGVRNASNLAGSPSDTINITRDGLSVTDQRFPNGPFGATVINPDVAGEVRLILTPVEDELGRRPGPVPVGQAVRAAGAPGIGPRNQVVMTREYAHALAPNWTENSRTDFAETLYWNPAVKTDASGKATVSFHLNDSITSFRVLADGFTPYGVLGSSESSIESVQPFFLDPKIPLQVSSGDVVKLPIGLVNGTARELRGLEITANTPGLKSSINGENLNSLAAKERARRLLEIAVDPNFNGSADIFIQATAGGYKDRVSRKLDIQPLGFPYEYSSGGVLDANSSRTFEFTLPDGLVRGSLSSSVVVYPSTLANMTEALQSLLQQPYGCFEQTSSTSYPMVMAQQYFLTHAGVEPAIIQKTRDLLETSYKRLTGFETQTRGYEWFGHSPAHEALTAYGLLQFTDMSKVRAVDKDMMDRTRAWLFERRDGHGGFNHSSLSTETLGFASYDFMNAYVVWALVESGQKGLEKEIAAVKESSTSTKDSYLIALGANILSETGDSEGALRLMEKLAKAQDINGSVTGATTSITRSGGTSLAIETTALSALAWMHDPAYASNVEKAMKWILAANRNGKFGSTQSTILALRSIVAYDAAQSRPKAPGRLLLSIDGHNVGSALTFTPNNNAAIVLPELALDLAPGRHTLALQMENGSRMPYSMDVKFNSNSPDSSPLAQIGIDVDLKDRSMQEGGVTEAVVSITNKSDQAIPTPVAIVGIPGGLEIRHDQLKELVKSGKIDAYEVKGREVVLYWRYLKAKDQFDVPLSLVAAIPGTYTGPASRAYLYYTDEFKSWARGVTVDIASR